MVLDLNNQLPGVSKGSCLEIFKHLRASKKHSFVTQVENKTSPSQWSLLMTFDLFVGDVFWAFQLKKRLVCQKGEGVAVCVAKARDFMGLRGLSV